MTEHNCKFESWFDGADKRFDRIDGKLDKLFDMVSPLVTEVQVQKNNFAIMNKTVSSILEVQDNAQKEIERINGQHAWVLGGFAAISMVACIVGFVINKVWK